VAHIISITRDITDRKRSEDEVKRLLATVQEEKEQLSCLLNSISDEVWFADHLSGKDRNPGEFADGESSFK
jgi:hypothetical protein